MAYQRYLDIDKVTYYTTLVLKFFTHNKLYYFLNLGRNKIYKCNLEIRDFLRCRALLVVSALENFVSKQSIAYL